MKENVLRRPIFKAAHGWRDVGSDKQLLFHGEGDNVHRMGVV